MDIGEGNVAILGAPITFLFTLYFEKKGNVGILGAPITFLFTLYFGKKR